MRKARDVLKSSMPAIREDIVNEDKASSIRSSQGYIFMSFSNSENNPSSEEIN